MASFDRKLSKAEEQAKQFLIIASKHRNSESFKTSYASKTRASVRRASMDLTRALADLRKGDNFGY